MLQIFYVHFNDVNLNIFGLWTTSFEYNKP